MNPKELGQLILYIVHQVEELGGYTNTIRLVKFLYLIDLEHQRRFGRVLTDLKWVFHLYGPYAFELPAVGERLGFDLQREEYVNSRGHRGSLVSAAEPQSFPAGLRARRQALVDVVLRVWADQNTWDLLDYVYRTEPMKGAQRGDPLNFAVVPKGTRFYKFYIPANEATGQRLRGALGTCVAEDETEFVRPETIHDEVLEEGLRILADGPPLAGLSGVLPATDLDSLMATLPRED